MSEPMSQDAPPPAPAPAVDPSKVVTSVAETVEAHPAIPSASAASVIANILAGLYQAEPALFAVTRASGQTQAAVGLGLGLAEVIVGAFLHRSA